MFGHMMGGPMGFSVSGKQMANAVLAEIIEDRRDHDKLVETIVEAYNGTFTHTTIDPITDRDRHVREFIETLLMTMRNAHIERVGDPMFDGRTIAQYLEDWREQAYKRARNSWIEAEEDEGYGDSEGEATCSG